MRWSRGLPVLAALTISVACRPQAATLSSADQQALRALPDSYVQRVRRADAYAKSEQGDLTPAQVKTLRRIVREEFP